MFHFFFFFFAITLSTRNLQNPPSFVAFRGKLLPLEETHIQQIQKREKETVRRATNWVR